MRLDADDFEVFGLPRLFGLDGAELDARWKALQGRVHPDRFAAEGAAAQRLAMQWAVRVNEAYQRLKDPLQRAATLCRLQGVMIDAEGNTAMPQDFLLRQLHWREALEDAGSEAQVDALASELAQERRTRLAHLERLLDEESRAGAAADEVRALMFIERFADDIERRRETLGQQEPIRGPE